MKTKTMTVVASRSCRFADAPLKAWIAEATKRGGAVTLDVHIDCPGGRIPAAQVEQFARVRP